MHRLKTNCRVNINKGIELILIISLLSACNSDNTGSKPAANSVASDSIALSKWLGGEAETGFERAINPRNFSFPEDHGSHDSFKIEWWYITGNLNTKPAGKEFGYQVTFFRIGLSPAVTPESVKNSSSWSTQDIWMAHIALSDMSAGKHYYDERLSRGSAGLAGIQKHPFKVWLEDWQILGINRDENKGEFPWKVAIKNKDFSLDVTMSPVKPVVLQGKNGLSQKSKAIGNASYYYSFTRLKTEGKLSVQNHQYTITGWSWLDREWSTSALGKEQAGWNWFSLQLEDGTDLMYYQLHNKDGSINPLSSGKWVDKDGAYIPLEEHEVKLKPLKYWHSPTGKKYVIEWQMTLAEKQISWRIKAMLDDQEMVTTVRYWEGAVRVFDTTSGKAIGKGYLEMTGY